MRMWLIHILVTAVMAAARLTPVHAGTPLAIDTDEFGPVTVQGAAPAATDFAFYFSAAHGIDSDDRKAVDALVAAGAEIALIDSRATLARLARGSADCVDIAGALEWLSRSAQHGRGTAYREPALLGRGAGGALVYIALAQAKPLAFRGGASLDFDPRLPATRPYCDLPPNSGDAVPPAVPLGAPWLLAGTAAIGASELAAYQGSAKLTPASVAGITGDFSARLRAALHALPRRTPAVGDSLADLPVVEVGLSSTRRTLVVLISGDGGWRDLDKTVADRMASHGYAVIGIDALHYFWSKRRADRTAADVARIIARYQSATASKDVVLIGFSFGAQVLPFVYNRLAPAVQREVGYLSLLAPARQASFEIHLDEWFGDAPEPTAQPVAPELGAIDHRKLQCIYGSEEAATSLCTEPAMRGARIEMIEGDHHFDEDYDALVARIESAIAAALPAH